MLADNTAYVNSVASSGILVHGTYDAMNRE